ncbi:hypothetical protein QO002_004288 [Pararhizobium capsulatum DSM 1112]|uniref:MFS transporter n=1 Tax=Pararhizobium capsulatum DSM 1112 TaxID=1121113 RepID=A0ABU0BVV0_9HYPH|nr:hypothetical protein [Pararhizobium capsulatum DSM 1112]
MADWRRPSAVAGIFFGVGAASFLILSALAKDRLDQVGGSTVTRGMAILRLVTSLSWTIGQAPGCGPRFEDGIPRSVPGAGSLAALSLAIVVITHVRAVATVSEERPKLGLEVAPDRVSNHCAGRVSGASVCRICSLRRVFPDGAPLANVDIALSRPNSESGRDRNHQHRRDGRRAGPLAGRAGIASALFGNTISVGFLLSGLGTGVWANGFGYWSLFSLCTGLCGLGIVALLPGRHTSTVSTR